ncbi:HNH endonuclease signature motif containing protein [Anaeromicrobium sediminis]|uniref:HNH nuclease domain-containing protein n=1 Tax=Anaeromicrobium sediminis TaxID=1478221 RepID=A0A267MPI2_9FIRM|nr:HNH endonuclease signature motif containing protein [Anaeromicrobium sediminis]PAB60815.1 hypothetical protein CCE28_04580 [Anaeromicrobium sediminis]
MNSELTLEKYKKAISRNQNSYKFALGLALIQTINNNRRVYYEEIIRKVADIYFKHHFIYKINESNNPNQVPIVITILEEYLKNVYGNISNIKKLSKEDLNALSVYLINPKKITNIINSPLVATKLTTNKGFFYYTLPCWQKAEKIKGKSYYDYSNSGENDFFLYDSNKKVLLIKEDFINLINTRKELLTDITVGQWVKFTEKFNLIPRLYQKISLDKPNRTTSKFNDIFDNLAVLEGDACIICNKKIYKDKTLDHLIPFSYIFSCELWNLARAHRTCNSSKNDKIGSQEMIDKLVRRNIRLWKLEDEIPSKYKNIYLNHFKSNFISINDMVQKIYKAVLECKSAGFEQMKDRESKRQKHEVEDINIISSIPDFTEVFTNGSLDNNKIIY